MRVLWFTNTPSCYKSKKGGYNGGGWISSAEKAIRCLPDIHLSVSFMMDGEPFKAEANGVTYYPVCIQQSLLSKVLGKLSRNPEKRQLKKWPKYIEQLKRVIDDFKPDIIHVFGSERYYGLVASETTVPVVLHIQGILNPYLNAFLPPAVNWNDYDFQNLKSFVKRVLIGSERLTWEEGCFREREIYKRIYHYMGRTEWDKRVTAILNPQAKYYHCDEILRDDFYQPAERTIPEKLTIVTTISNPPYKGFDLLLKTAYFLKNNLGIDFEWQAFGNIDPTIAERRYGINCKDVNVKLMGVASSDELRKAELSATIYVHTSYIDNSPNSLCEAQMLGVACISTNVGGILSLIEDGKTGFIVPANDPYQMTYLINKLYRDKDLNISLGKAAHEAALKRHNKDTIVNDILNIYEKVVERAKHN